MDLDPAQRHRRVFRLKKICDLYTWNMGYMGHKHEKIGRILHLKANKESWRSRCYNRYTSCACSYWRWTVHHNIFILFNNDFVISEEKISTSSSNGQYMTVNHIHIFICLNQINKLGYNHNTVVIVQLWWSLSELY